MKTRFADRREAGRYLARELGHYAHRSDVQVLALPRGGVPVAAEVAQRLELPLDLFIVRKLGVPGHEEYAMGAMASGGIVFLNEDVLEQLRISDAQIHAVIEREKRELKRREDAYRPNLPPLELEGKTVILIDDGLATGSTMRAAVESVRHHHPAKVVVAIPVASASTFAEFQNIADETVAVLTPEIFYAVGQWYEDFSQTTDEEVRDVLDHLTPSRVPMAH